MFHTDEIVIGLLAAAVVLGILARWAKIPDPILLTCGGLVLSLQPWAPDVALESNVVFFLFLPPLLYAGAFRTPWRDFLLYMRPISLLAVGCVFATTAAVATVAHYYIGLPWAVGAALGAIVSPPDAVAAMAITKRLKVPRRVTSILEGESLVNDAAALVTLRMAVAAVTAGTFSLVDAAGQFALISLGGIVLGLAVGWTATKLHPMLDRAGLVDAKLSITITLLTPYAAYIPAEHLHVSGILAVVAAGLWVGTRCESVFSQELYEEAHSVWEWLEFFLNGMIFILMGFQLPRVLNVLGDRYAMDELVWYAVAVSLTAILLRLVWVFPAAYLPRLLSRRIRTHEPAPPWQGIVVVGWTGLRGVVSLAASLALPADFPNRNLIVFLTFWVIFATLVGQGLTLPVLIRVLGVGRMPIPEAPKPEEAPVEQPELTG
ncbi:MAG TPA: Na+/H+ antiporter [Fimbriiglobus sp.]|jgi:CPA1 family monovalent cation:H+ antiporter